MLPIMYIFMSPNPKIGEFVRIRRMRDKILIFKKITGTLKINIFFRKCENIFLLLQRTIAKKMIWNKKLNKMLLGPQNGKIGFWLGQRKNKFFEFLKKKFPAGAGQKNVS